MELKTKQIKLEKNEESKRGRKKERRKDREQDFRVFSIERKKVKRERDNFTSGFEWRRDNNKKKLKI